MSEIVGVLKRAPRQLLALALVLLCGFGFSIYKAVGAFGPQQESPAYEQTPSQAFALPETPSIVDPDKLREPRLPDDVYEQTLKRADTAFSRIANRNLGAGYLEREGMRPRQAKDSASAALSALSGYAGHPITVTGDPILSPGDGTISIGRVVDVGPSPSGAPGSSINVTATYSLQGMKLAAITVDF